MIKIITPCDSFKHFDEPIQEFVKRLWKEIELRKIKPSKRKEISEIISEETWELIKVLEKEKWFIVLMYINCKQLSTEQFYDFIETKKMNYGNIIFVIGWAHGVDDDRLKQYIDYKISLSPMTFPHAQAIMMLLEQIYRINCMKKWIWYHH